MACNDCGTKHYIDVFCELIELGASIGNVEYFFYEDIPERPAAIRFMFGGAPLFVFANAVDDTVGLSRQVPPDLSEMLVQDRSLTEPWGDMLEAKFGWCWALTNQQGYVDGIQVQFHDVEGRAVR